MQLLAKTSVLSIHFDEQHQWLYAQWHGELNKVRVLEGCELLLDR